MLVVHQFKGQRGKRRVIGRFAHFFFQRVRVGGRDRAFVNRRGQVLNDRIQQRLNALVLIGRAAQDRDDLKVNGSFADGFFQFVRRDRLFHQELLNQRIIALGDFFHHLGAVLGGLFLQVGRNVHHFKDFAVIALVDNGAVFDQVNHALKVLLGPDGDLKHDGICAQAVFDRADGEK